jgi:predicted amidohydrolase YtcJ
MNLSSSRRVCVALLSALAAAGCTRTTADPSEMATLVLRGGRIVTVDDSRPEAQAMAVRGDTIVALGSDREIARHVGPDTEVIELQGRLAIPGFIEGHGHFMGVGDAQMQLKLQDAKSWDEIVAMVAEAVKAAQPGELIRGRGWHQEKWDPPPSPSVEGLPTHQALSRVSPDNPVILTHASGHATFANAKAMEMAGIARATRNPPGGEIVRDAQGNPTGGFRETASQLLAPARAGARESDPRRRVELATQEVLSKGVTSFQDAGSSFDTIDVFKAMADEGALGVRLWVMVRDSNDRMREKLAAYRTIDAGDKRLTVRGIKHSIDGALGSHGAWLLEPYADMPESTGLNTTPIATIEETARLALEHGYQLCVHAIGDRGNRETLDLFERAFGDRPEGGRDLRWRVEHAQHLHPDDIPRFGQLGVIASMQGIHCTSDAPWVTPRLGPKRAEEGAYVWQSLMRSGALVTNGTDAPVEDVDPVASFYATVTRRLDDGSTFYPEERMSRTEALKSYTLNAAYAAFEEDTKGSLAPGKLADITVLSKDIMTVPDEEIPTAEVVYTIVGGEIAYSRDPAVTTTRRN